jgi:hypothetical protein
MLSALVPVGMMPRVSSEGTLTLVICTGHGAEERSFPLPDDDPDRAASWCPFTLLGASLLPPAPIEAARTAPFAAVEPVFAALDIHRDAALGRPRPRGPPPIH